MKKIQSLKIINQIEKIRSKNNKNWMDLLRLSFNLDPIHFIVKLFFIVHS